MYQSQDLCAQIVDHRSGRELEDSQRMLVTTPVRKAPEPVLRRMIPLTLPAHGQVARSRFTVLTYNILADLYATQQAFPSSDPCSLLWQYRRQLIFQELAMYDADIVCLQEVQSTSFHDDLRPEMERRGFDSVFKKKTQVKPLRVALHSQWCTVQYMRRVHTQYCAMLGLSSPGVWITV